MKPVIKKKGTNELQRPVIKRLQQSTNCRHGQGKGPGEAAGGRGLGKAGAKRLGQMLKRVIQEEDKGKGRGTDHLPTTPIRLLKHKAQRTVQTQGSKGKSKATAPRVSELILTVISQCKRRGGVSMVELKQALTAGGYDVTKNYAKVNLAMKGLVRKEAILQTSGLGSSGSFKINKKKLTGEKSIRTRAMRKKDAAKNTADQRPKPVGKNGTPGQTKAQKDTKAIVRSMKTHQKGIKLETKGQSRAGKTPKARKAVNKTR